MSDQSTIADTPLSDSVLRALGRLPVPVVPKPEPIAPAKKHSIMPIWFLLALCLIGAMFGCALIGIGYLVQPDCARALPISATGDAIDKIGRTTPATNERVETITIHVTMIPTPTPQPTATATPALIELPAQPKWMTAGCLFQIEGIVSGESSIVGGDSLRFVAEQVLRDAYRLKCIGLAKRWYATGEVSDEVRAAVVDAMRDWPMIEWPICDWVIGAADMRRVMASDKAAAIGVVFSSPDHRWAVIGLGCREAGK